MWRPGRLKFALIERNYMDALHAVCSTDRITLEDTYQYDDSANDTFQREPYCVKFRLHDTGLSARRHSTWSCFCFAKLHVIGAVFRRISFLLLWYYVSLKYITIWFCFLTFISLITSLQPPKSLLVFVCAPPTDTSSSFLAVDSASKAVGLFRLRARRSGTRYQTIS